MTGVVIRCPHCGTTQASLGECEACHEGETRYFCPNHTPGRWLDSPACTSCGARLGVAPPGAPALAPPRSGRSSAAATPPARATRPPRRTDGLPRYDTAPPPRPRDPDDYEVLTGEVRGKGSGAARRSGSELLDMLVRAAGAAAASRAAARVPRHPAAAAASTGSSLFGCLRRLVILAVVLIILAMVAFVMLFGQGGLLYRATMSGARSDSARNRLVEGVPAIRGRDSPFQLRDERTAVVTIGHDRHAVSLPEVRDEVPLEAPVGATVAEIPTLAPLRDRETDGVPACADGCEHLAY